MLYLIDSSIYIFRAWQSLPPDLKTTDGDAANALFGFTDMLASLVSQTQAQHIVCAFDQSHRKGERHRIYPEYKANRPEAPAELQIQFAKCVAAAGALGLPGYGSARVEADDIIGQFARLAQAHSEPVTIISGDKDLAQFIGPNDVYWDYAKHQKQSARDLHKRFKVQTHQIADWLALCGDKSDNIPGVPGVGPTTAARLLTKWGNLEVLLQNLGKVADMQFRGAPRVARLLHEHKADIHLARQLTGLIEDSNLPTTLSALQRQALSSEQVQAQLMAIGFNDTRSARLADRVAVAETS